MDSSPQGLCIAYLISCQTDLNFSQLNVYRSRAEAVVQTAFLTSRAGGIVVVEYLEDSKIMR